MDDANKTKIDAEVADASKTPREILRLIFEMVRKTVEPDAINIRLTIARFATLLVNLSEQADKIHRQMVRLNWTLVFLTLALLVFAAIQIFHR